MLSRLTGGLNHLEAASEARQNGALSVRDCFPAYLVR